MRTRQSLKRRAGWAAILVTLALSLAAPAFADESSDDSQTADRTLDWATAVSDDGVARPDFIAADDQVEIVQSDGVTPAGVEWSRVSFIDADGVVWSRTHLTSPDGTDRVTVAAVETSGVKVTYTAGTRPDGTPFVASSFVNAAGVAFARKAPGTSLSGVEWTKRVQ